jgi:hypothetical protein
MKQPQTINKGIISGIITLVCVAVLSAGFIAWRSYSARSGELAQFNSAKQALASGHPDQALTIISIHRSFGAIPRKEWADLELSALEQSTPPSIPQLTTIYFRDPTRLATHEKAILIVARAMLDSRDLPNLKKLRQSWMGKETQKVEWYQIDTDALILSGRTEQARKVLTGTRLPGTADAERLLRLATLEATNGNQTVLAHLEQAVAANPKNAKVRSLRGTLFEKNREFDKARAEYVAALGAEPDNDFYRDQLGEFYRRYGKYDQALETWGAGANNGKDFLQLKTLFWGRMVRPVEPSITSGGSGDLSALVHFVSTMPAGSAWDQDAFNRLIEARRFEATRQEVFWLKLVSALNRGEEDIALTLLTYNPFQEHSWHPDLERALLRTLVFRVSGELKYPMALNVKFKAPPEGNRHQYFELLDRYTGKKAADLPKELRAFLKTRGALSAPFIAAGWREAGLRLIGDEMAAGPEWFQYELAQANLANYGSEKALQFIARQPQATALDELKGEILLAERKPLDAIPLLKKSAGENSAIGARAALALSVAYIAQHNLPQAEQILRNNALALGSDPGKQLLARINPMGGGQAKVTEASLKLQPAAK